MDKLHKYQFDKRIRITSLNKIIYSYHQDNTSITDLDVLLRGSLILIYAFWEGNYHFLEEEFYNFFLDKRISDLPSKIQDSILFSLAKDNQGSPISKINSYKSIVDIDLKLKNSMDKIAKSLQPKPESFKQFFGIPSMNPKYEVLRKFCEKYDVDFKGILQTLKADDMISKNFEKNLECIISCRNKIAHGDEKLINASNYMEYIDNSLVDVNTKEIGDIISFLNKFTADINTVYLEIMNSWIEIQELNT